MVRSRAKLPTCGQSRRFQPLFFHRPTFAPKPDKPLPTRSWAPISSDDDDRAR